jgi:hypothetical protein
MVGAAEVMKMRLLLVAIMLSQQIHGLESIV